MGIGYRPYGSTASTPMQRHFAGPPQTLGSRGETPSLESFDRSTLGSAVGGRTHDPVTGRFINNITQKESLKSLYDLNAPKMNSSMAGSFPTEIMDFPDVFGLPDMADTWIDRLNERQLWPLKTMPLRLTDSLDYNYVELIYNNTTPTRGAEESVPTLVTKQFYSRQQSLVRWHKGAKTERGSYLTSRGRKEFVSASHTSLANSPKNSLRMLLATWSAFSTVENVPPLCCLPSFHTRTWNAP
jgi:hypothetical protein